MFFRYLFFGAFALLCFSPISSLQAAGYRIIPRSEWGADQSYLTKTVDTQNALDTSTSERSSDCAELRAAFPSEFTTQRTMTHDNGKPYVWPLQYSDAVKLMVIHHTAITVGGDNRTGAERMRALYKYHAVTKQWGDIGYHFVIDEDGNIYEGRYGGKFVVGGHAYCHNIGTIGIALMGNFQVEKPTEKQAKSLQWLLIDLASSYSIPLHQSVTFHGKKLSAPIVGHRDLGSTACPGEVFFQAIDQIRAHVLEGNSNADVRFPDPPQPPKKEKSVESSFTPTFSDGIEEGIHFTGRSTIGMNPGGKQRLSFSYTAGEGGVYQGKKIATLALPHPDVKLWIDDGLNLLPVRTAILSPSDIPSFETIQFQLVIQAPLNPGTYPISIGGIPLTLIVEGRRARTGTFNNPFTGNQTLVVRPQAQSSARSVRPKDVSLRTSSVKQSPSSRRSVLPSSSSFHSSLSSSSSSFSQSSPIRIKLSSDTSPILTFIDAGWMNDRTMPSGTSVQLLARNQTCVAMYQGRELMQSGILRFRSTNINSSLSINAIAGVPRQYQGVLECRVINNVLTIMNELPLEQYMEGLAEEPDSEPYEKQRAFAIAARTYAFYYLSSGVRKFPNLPYDGSDDPATFQVYRGSDFSRQNPQWLQAVRSTSKQILTKDGVVIRPPYFSSDDGVTRSPSEAGWNNFPFSEIFTKKPDPWCTGLPLRGHGVGMSGCGAKGQAKEGRSAEQILQYYYPTTRIVEME